MRIDTLRTIIPVGHAENLAIEYGVESNGTPDVFIKRHVEEFMGQLYKRYVEIGLDKIDQITLQVEFRWSGVR